MSWIMIDASNKPITPGEIRVTYYFFLLIIEMKSLPFLSTCDTISYSILTLSKNYNEMEI